MTGRKLANQSQPKDNTAPRTKHCTIGPTCYGTIQTYAITWTSIRFTANTQETGRIQSSPKTKMRKVFTILVLCAIYTPHSEGKLYFQPIGQFNPSPSYRHIHFTIDTHLIIKQITNIRDTIAYIRKLVQTVSHDSVQHRARNFLLRAHLDIDTMSSEFKDLLRISI
jgi:hypothetical protein